MSSNNSGLIKSEIAALYVNNVRISYITDVSISFNNELREIVGSSTVRQHVYGRDSWSLTANGLVTFSEGYNWDYLMHLLDSYEQLTIKMFTNNAGTEYIEGIILMESMDLKTGNAGEVISCSMSFKGNGPLSRTLIEYAVEGTTPKVDADDAGCTKQHPETYYIENTNNSYPYLQVGDIVYLDAAHTTALTGYANKYIGLKYQAGTAYQLDAAGEVTTILATTCTDLTQ